jgi:MurNAc alpha-1-phosphate uridylyltransferase
MTAPPQAAMVLAAGLGTRMRPLTERMPKAMVPVAGRALVDHALDRVAEAGIPRATVNLHHMGDMLAAHLAGRTHPEIALSREDGLLLDTGGGVARAQRAGLLGDGAFAVLNSDAIWTGASPLRRLAGAWAPGRMDALMLLVPRERARGYTRAGDFFLDADGGAPRRRGGAGAASHVFTGAQILAPAALEGVPEGPFSLNIVWDRLLASGRLAAVVHDGAWVDVGTPAGIAEAEAALAEEAGA